MQLVGFLFFGFEIQPGKEYPEVKVYVPGWTCDIGAEWPISQSVSHQLRIYFN
jgi:hypothetical protein